MILSPERSACVRTSLPFTNVPFVEPTSTTTYRPPSKRISA
jgi:hypothetical protein